MAHAPGTADLVTHTLWRGDVLLGRGILTPLPGVAGALHGAFKPSPAFGDVWPALRALQEAGAAVALGPSLLATLDGPDALGVYLRAHPAVPALQAATEAVRALGLTVEDAAGHALEGIEARVSAWGLPAFAGEGEEHAERTRAFNAMREELGAPEYLLQVFPQRRTLTPPPEPGTHAREAI